MIKYELDINVISDYLQLWVLYQSDLRISRKQYQNYILELRTLNLKIDQFLHIGVSSVPFHGMKGHLKLRLQSL